MNLNKTFIFEYDLPDQLKMIKSGKYKKSEGKDYPYFIDIWGDDIGWFYMDGLNAAGSGYEYENHDELNEFLHKKFKDLWDIVNKAVELDKKDPNRKYANTSGPKYYQIKTKWKDTNVLARWNFRPGVYVISVETLWLEKNKDKLFNIELPPIKLNKNFSLLI